jgi:hypothetical protein
MTSASFAPQRWRCRPWEFLWTHRVNRRVGVRGGFQLRFLKRQLSLPVSTMSQ